MPIDTNVLTPEKQQQAGHYEVLGEIYVAFELFENGWNPYSRFLDVDKVDFILRKLHENKPIILLLLFLKDRDSNALRLWASLTSIPPNFLFHAC
jgi:hypothetical protein